MTPPSLPQPRNVTLASGEIEVPADRLLQDWRKAYDRALAYLAALGIPDDARDALAREAIERALQVESWDAGSDAVGEALRALRDLLPVRCPAPARSWPAAVERFLAWRLSRFLPPEPTPTLAAGAKRERFIASMPPLSRRFMVPEHLERRIWRRLINRFRLRRPPASAAALRGSALRAQRRRLPWIRVAIRRRLLLAVLVLIPSVVASGYMVNVLPHQGRTWLETAIVLFFGALFGWISIGFWTALLGFFTLMLGRDRFAISRLEAGEDGPLPQGGRTAIVMPICEEPVERVFAGLQTIYQSVARTGNLEHFDFFIISDSSKPGTWVEEEEAWARWCRAVNGFDRIFYRRRKVRQKRKSGNVADFCRRWGTRYRYMVMLDADSIMAGETIVRLVRMMERHPDAGMIQTAPSAVNRRSLFARVQQFASRVYGPMFAAGLHFWQLGDGQYWGHNTIIRTTPFMDHCGLPRLPGKPPLGGEIMSHDFVEAALMGRAGWTLWLAYDLGGSYEEVPPSLLEEMKRDRRWCQGNLQHLRLLFTEGLFGAHRALFINGVLSYMSALLWFIFLTLSTVEAIQMALAEPDYFPHGPSLFPEWPIWRPDWAYSLLAVIAMLLFLPKLLSIVLIIIRGRNTRAYGGVMRLTLSVFFEIVLSSLFAPIRMVFHSRFVIQNLLRRTVTWRSQEREDAETGWREAIRHHSLDTLFASAWGIALYVLNPDYFWWLTPIIGALILSVPVSALVSRVRLGDLTRAWGLFLIPEEYERPLELRELDDNLRAAQEQSAALPPRERDGFIRAVVDPTVNALHRALLGRPRSLRPGSNLRRDALLGRGLSDGPDSLDLRERRLLLSDPRCIDDLHLRVWAIPERERAARWGRPGLRVASIAECGMRNAESRSGTPSS
jgi:membrane glycosyltransferase